MHHCGARVDRALAGCRNALRTELATSPREQRKRLRRPEALEKLAAVSIAQSRIIPITTTIGNRSRLMLAFDQLEFRKKSCKRVGAWCRPTQAPSELVWEFSSPATCSRLRFLGGMATTICRLSSARSTWRKPFPLAFCRRKSRPASPCRS